MTTISKLAYVATATTTALLVATSAFGQGIKLPKGDKATTGLSTELSGQIGDSGAVSVDGIVAIVNSDVITRSELDRQLATIERQMIRKGVPLPDRRDLRDQVLERMIMDNAQVQRAAELGIRVDDAQVDATMQRVAEQNQMTLEEFLLKLREDGIRPERFRKEVENELIIARLKEQEVDSRIQVSDSEVQAWLANRSKGELSVKPQVNWVQLLVRAPSSEEGGASAAKAAQIEAALKKGLSVQEILKTNPDLEIDGTGQMGWQTFDDVPSLFTDFLTNAAIDSTKTIRSPNGYHVLKVLGRKQSGLAGLDAKPVTQTHARHILIRVTPEVSEADARRQLQFVIDKIKTEGADFATLARQYSVDGSAAKGGDLGWLYPGDTVPEFERAMNELKPGEISGIVPSRFGLHVIMVDERRQQAISEDRQKFAARQAIRADKSQESYNEWLRQLKDRTFIDIRL